MDEWIGVESLYIKMRGRETVEIIRHDVDA